VETGAVLEVVSTAAAEELATLPAEVGTTTPVLVPTAEETTAEETTAEEAAAEDSTAVAEEVEPAGAEMISPMEVEITISLGPSELATGAAEVVAEMTVVRVSVTGQIVVEVAMVTTVVVTWPAGQLVTVGAQLVMVWTSVTKMVEVLSKLVTMVLVMGGADTTSLMGALVVRTGTLSAGALSTGALSTGALSTGALSTGALSTGALSTGALSTGAELALDSAGLDSIGTFSAGALVISAGALLVWLPGMLSAGALEEATGAAEVVVASAGTLGTLEVAAAEVVEAPSVVLVLVLGGTVLCLVLQSKEMVLMMTLQLGLGFSG
jgi:hypothetical protein